MQSFVVLKELLGSTYMPYLEINNKLEEKITLSPSLENKAITHSSFSCQNLNGTTNHKEIAPTRT